jgi:hypothetical protein
MLLKRVRAHRAVSIVVAGLILTGSLLVAVAVAKRISPLSWGGLVHPGSS